MIRREFFPILYKWLYLHFKLVDNNNCYIVPLSRYGWCKYHRKSANIGDTRSEYRHRSAVRVRRVCAVILQGVIES